jgi:hypothetical protein
LIAGYTESNHWMTLNNELERIWKVVLKFEVLSPHLPRETKKQATKNTSVPWTIFQPKTSKMQPKIVSTDTILLVRSNKKKDTLLSNGELFNTLRLHSGLMMIVHYTVTKSNLTL